MRVLVVYAHPLETSYIAAVHRQVVDALKGAGHEVDDLDLYGTQMAADFVTRIRGQARFDSVAELISQMHQDVAAARQVLAGQPGGPE